MLLFQCVKYPSREAVVCLDKLTSGNLAPKYGYSPANLRYCRDEAQRRLDRGVARGPVELTSRDGGLFERLLKEEYTFQTSGESLEDLQWPDVDAPSSPPDASTKDRASPRRRAKATGRSKTQARPFDSPPRR
jgi:hypothetical protein